MQKHRKAKFIIHKESMQTGSEYNVQFVPLKKGRAKRERERRRWQESENLRKRILPSQNEIV